jgi:ABC-2 type transport system ATP-binding protein
VRSIATTRSPSTVNFTTERRRSPILTTAPAWPSTTADRVAIMHAGELVALGPPSALLERIGSEILEFRTHGDPAAAVRALRERGAAGGDAFAVGARVTVPLHGRAASEALAVIDGERIGASELQVRRPNLEDVYIQLTGAPVAEAA